MILAEISSGVNSWIVHTGCGSSTGVSSGLSPCCIVSKISVKFVIKTKYDFPVILALVCNLNLHHNMCCSVIHHLFIPSPLTEMNKHGVIEVFRHHNPKSTQILLEQWESSPFQHHSFHRPLAAFRDKSYTICPFHLPCLTFEFCCRVYYSIALLEVNSDFFLENPVTALRAIDTMQLATQTDAKW